MQVARSVVQREWRGAEQDEAMLMLDILDRHGSDPWQQDLFARRDEEYASALVRAQVWSCWNTRWADGNPCRTSRKRELGGD
jgi:hypothetical protein